MALISEGLLSSEYQRWKSYFDHFDKGLGVDFGIFMNTKYMFKDKQLPKCKSADKAYKIITEKYVKR